MGYSLSWIAVKDRSLDETVGLLGLRRTGQREEIPESPIAGAELPDGWCLIVFNEGCCSEAALKKVSASGELVSCAVEEHVMCSASSAWAQGKQKWSVVHNAQKGVHHLDVSGEPPPVFSTIRDALQTEQAAAGGERAEADSIFDIPVNLAAELTGFRYDQDIPDAGGNPFEVLTKAHAESSPGRRPWWKLW